MSKPVFRLRHLHRLDPGQGVQGADLDMKRPANSGSAMPRHRAGRSARRSNFHREGKLILQGKILENDPPRRLSYSFRPMHDENFSAEQPSRVVFELEQQTRPSQAHRHPRRFRRRQQSLRQHQQRLAAGAVQSQELSSRPERRRSTRLGTTRRKRRPRPERSRPRRLAGDPVQPQERAGDRQAAVHQDGTAKRDAGGDQIAQDPVNPPNSWRFRTRQGRLPLGFCQRLGPIPAYRGRTGW